MGVCKLSTILSDVSHSNGVLPVLLQLLHLKISHDEVGLLPSLGDVLPVELVRESEAFQSDAEEFDPLEEEDGAPILATLSAERLAAKLYLAWIGRGQISSMYFAYSQP